MPTLPRGSTGAEVEQALELGEEEGGEHPARRPEREQRRRQERRLRREVDAAFDLRRHENGPTGVWTQTA